MSLHSFSGDQGQLDDLYRELVTLLSGGLRRVKCESLKTSESNNVSGSQKN